MANDITNTLTVEGTPEQIEEVFTFLKSKKTDGALIDFENITPMPIWVYGSSPDVIALDPELEAKYGRQNTSIYWRYENWGTKWNAYEIYRKDNILYFYTANGTPVKLIEKVAWLFPNVTLTHEFYDKMNPFNQYTCVFKDTDVTEKVKRYILDEETCDYIEVKEND